MYATRTDVKPSRKTSHIRTTCNTTREVCGRTVSSSTNGARFRKLAMNHNPTPRWSPLVSGPEDDFANFLDFGDLNFSTFGDGSVEGTPQVNGTSGDAGPMDTSLEGAGNGEVEMMSHPAIQQNPMAHSMHAFQEAFPEMSSPVELLSRQHSQHHQQALIHMQQHPRYYGHNAVPPTPNGLEMHGNHPEYYNPADRQQQLMYEHYRRHQNEQMNFTPLVSPAVTPLDTTFQRPDYAASTDGFSPLTSPALRAQNHSAHHSVYGAMRGSDTSDTTSPIDPQLDYPAPTSGQTRIAVRKSKRKTSTDSTKNPSRGVRQSPVVKPQSRRKQTSSAYIPPKEVERVLEEARPRKHNGTPTSADGRLPLPYSQDSSGADSVSPEPLSEILMPPPATPKSSSASRSPYLAAKNGGAQQQPSPAITAKEAPATPASLMKIRKGQGGKVLSLSRSTSSLKEQAMLAEADMEQIMEVIALPEPASTSKKPTPRPIIIPGANGHRLKPQSANRTPTAASAPVTATSSSFPSPTASALTSPNGITNGRRNGDQPKLKIRDPKKRSSSSTQISPALRPKISPSIKPLLPEGAVVSPETSALLLASKSNYQNILEGTHLPGVSYPETLSTNLTSKRTSHKIAEQGRRNRINTALQEIASLLPPQTPPTNAQNGNGGQTGLMMTGSAAQQSNSKASTVELAIEYIKTLKRENESKDEEIAELRRERAQASATNEDTPMTSEKDTP